MTNSVLLEQVQTVVPSASISGTCLGVSSIEYVRLEEPIWFVVLPYGRRSDQYWKYWNGIMTGLNLPLRHINSRTKIRQHRGQRAITEHQLETPWDIITIDIYVRKQWVPIDELLAAPLGK